MKDSDWKIIRTLYECKNITQAANNLFLTQPTLSKRLKSIELELGFKLVERNTKGVVFTRQGEFLAQQSVKILEQIERTLDQVSSMKSGEVGILRIGATNTFVRFKLPDIIKNYHALYPNIQFQVETDFSSATIKKVKGNELHVGFIQGECPFDGESYLIAQNHVFAAYNRLISPEELPNLPQVNYRHDIYTNKLLTDWWKDCYSKPPNILMEVNHGDACKAMVKDGLGYGIFLIDEYLEVSDKLVKTKLYWKNGEPLLRGTWMIYEKKWLDNPLVNNFLKFIKSSR